MKENLAEKEKKGFSIKNCIVEKNKQMKTEPFAESRTATVGRRRIE